jgi:hypothetical protein
VRLCPRRHSSERFSHFPEGTVTEVHPLLSGSIFNPDAATAAATTRTFTDVQVIPAHIAEFIRVYENEVLDIGGEGKRDLRLQIIVGACIVGVAIAGHLSLGIIAGPNARMEHRVKFRAESINARDGRTIHRQDVHVLWTRIFLIETATLMIVGVLGPQDALKASETRLEGRFTAVGAGLGFRIDTPSRTDRRAGCAGLTAGRRQADFGGVTGLATFTILVAITDRQTPAFDSVLVFPTGRGILTSTVVSDFDMSTTGFALIVIAISIGATDGIDVLGTTTRETPTGVATFSSRTVGIFFAAIFALDDTAAVITGGAASRLIVVLNTVVIDPTLARASPSTLRPGHACAAEATVTNFGD